MKKFIDVLQEKPRTIAFTFGRFNPPTIGHGKLLDKLNSVRADDTFIYASHSQNPEKDPLQYVKKIAYMKQSFPKYAKNIVVSKARTIFEIVVEIQKKYNPANAETMSLTMVVGSDRVKEFKTLLNTYNGVESRHGYYKFKTIQVISAGQRDPDAEGVTGMSASKMRVAAEMSDFDSFKQGTTLKGAQAKKLYFDVRKSMGIKEELDLSDFEVVRDLYLSEQIWNVGDLVVTNEGCGEIIRRGTNYVTIVKENYKVEKVWLHDIQIDENQKVKQDKDIKDREGTQPAKYYGSKIAKSTKQKRAAQFKKQTKMDDDDPRAYKPAPGDATGKTKPSKHTKKFKQMFGEQKYPCPPATQDLAINTKNRDKTIKKYNYGPLNVTEPGDYWKDIAKYWKTTEAAAKKSLCANCIAFDISPRMDDCMPGETSDKDGRLGYCWMHHFKCHSARACHTWAKGGPIKTDEKSNEFHKRSSLPKEVKEEDNPRIPRKKGQPAGSKKHSDLYTDENPEGTIHGLGFKDVETAKASVAKIERSDRTHAHKIQAAVAMEQRAKEMGKKAEAAIYRTYIEKMKRKTKRMREFTDYMYERAPDTQDAMKRYKAGKAGFTDIAHLKAKGLIKRADGTKRKSEMNEEFKFYPKDLHEYIQLPDFPHDDEKEMSIVRKFISTRTDKDVESVANNDEDSFYSIKQYLRKIKVAFHENELRDIVQQAVPTIRHFKNKFNRDRPFELDGNLDVLGSKTNKTRSYPSGHSTQSTIIGLYVSQKFPEHKDGIMEAAKEVGMGRVKAGFHYLSDHIAGQMLGQKMFEMMNKEDYGQAMKEYYEIGTDNYVNYLKDITPGEEKQAEYNQIAEEKKKCPRCGAINETPFDKCHNCGLPHDEFATYDKNEKLNAFGEIDEEAEYQGRKVKLNNPTKGDIKKFKVYVRNDKGNVIKVEFGDPNMDIKRDSPERLKAFRARHNCDQKKDKTTAGYWSCKFWEKGKTVTDLMKG